VFGLTLEFRAPLVSERNLFKTLAVKGEFREVKEIEGKEHA
jgi:hypothetical protein